MITYSFDNHHLSQLYENEHTYGTHLQIFKSLNIDLLKLSGVDWLLNTT